MHLNTQLVLILWNRPHQPHQPHQPAFTSLIARPIALYRSYYDPKGLDYNVGRLNMGGCDFSARGYTYLDTEGDVLLETFSLQEEDTVYKV